LAVGITFLTEFDAFIILDIFVVLAFLTVEFVSALYTSREAVFTFVLGIREGSSRASIHTFKLIEETILRALPAIVGVILIADLALRVSASSTLVSQRFEEVVDAAVFYTLSIF